MINGRKFKVNSRKKRNLRAQFLTGVGPRPVFRLNPLHCPPACSSEVHDATWGRQPSTWSWQPMRPSTFAHSIAPARPWPHFTSPPWVERVSLIPPASRTPTALSRPPASWLQPPSLPSWALLAFSSLSLWSLCHEANRSLWSNHQCSLLLPLTLPIGLHFSPK